MPTALLRSIDRLNAPTVQRLPNGLTLIVEQMPVEAVNLSLWLGVGSAVETHEINGMAHYLEHMIFKGSDRLVSGEFERLIEQRGAVTNAATSQDYTHYYITTAPQDFANLAPHQIEVVLNAAIPDAAFERERSVILEEIRRSEDNAQRRTFYRSMQAGFDQLPYRRPVLGTTNVIEHLTARQMREFHRTWYQPQSMTAVAVGNLPKEQLIDIITQSFETAQSTVQSEPALLNAPIDLDEFHPDYPAAIAEAPFTETTRYDYIDSTLQQARLVMMWRVPGMTELSETYGLDMLASILARGRTARLVKDLREEKRWVNNIAVSNMTYAHQGLFYISAQLPVEHLEKVEAAIAQQIHQLHQDLVSDLEIQRLRTLVANRYIFGNETPSDRAGLYGYYQAVVGDIAPAINYPAEIQAIEAIDLQRVAQQYLSPEAYRVVTIRPE
jgi:zinc protease